MTPAPNRVENARAELAALFPLRDEFARRAGRMRAELLRTPAPRSGRIDARALRCERLVRLLDTRIRLAAEVLASGGPAPPPA